MHAALRKEHACDRVHVRDDGVDRERVVRREPCIHRLERVDPLGTGVGHVLADLRRQLAEPADGDELGEVGGDEVERGVDIAVDEVLHLVAIELGDEVDIPAVAGSLVRTDHRADLLGHLVDIGVNVEHGSVGVERSVERRYRLEREPVLHGLADCVEAVGDEVGHREDGRAGIEPVGAISRLDVQAPGPPARNRLALEDGDRAARSCEPHRGREPGEARTDDDDVIGRTGDGPHPAPG